MNTKQTHRANTKWILFLVGIVAAVAIAMSATFGLKAHAVIIEEKTIGDYTYTFYTDSREGGTWLGSLWIKTYNGSDAQVVIPTSVTAQLQGDTSPQTYPPAGGLIAIDAHAFEGNTTLQKVAIPAGVEAIAEGAFANCPSLTEIAIADDVVYISTNAFAGCPNLKTYRISGTNSNLSPSSFENSGLGQDSEGNVYAGATVYTVKDSAVDKYVKSLNEANSTGNQITLVYEADPFSNHTVVPTTQPASETEDTGDSPSTTPENSGSSTPTDGSTNSGQSTSTDKPYAFNGAGTTPKPSTSSQPADASKQLGKDGTAYGKGASSKAIDKAAASYAKEADPVGTVYNLLKAKLTKVTNKSVKLKWSKVKGATKYVVYGNKCGKKQSLVKILTTKKTANVFKKVNKKAVKKGTYYKFMVCALDKNNNVLSTSKIVHAATKGGSVGNDKQITTAAANNKVTLKAGKTFMLKAKAVPASADLKVKRHRKVAYESTKPGVAKVSDKGTITAVKKGSCYVYAYAQNGVAAKVKVTVK